MEDLIQPHAQVVLRLPSDTLKIERIKPNTTISLGKYGSFQANHILGRPFHLTFEIVDDPTSRSKSSLRIVPAAELSASLSSDGAQAAGESGEGAEYEVVDSEDKVVMQTNRDIVDDNASQQLTMDDIERLKQAETASGKDTIARIMESHTALDKKTAFALAKYTLRKEKKYLRRFTVLPLDVPLLSHYLMYEKDAAKIMEIREEILSLICSWSNVHYSDPPSGATSPEEAQQGRWLVVDETGGLVVAAMAEQMGILHMPTESPDEHTNTQDGPTEEEGEGANGDFNIASDTSAHPKRAIPRKPHIPATSNTLTMIHANSQPNLSLLTYFSFDATAPSTPHPLFTHLSTLSWLQLLHPTSDTSYAEPPRIPSPELSALKSGKRSTYYRKRRRWERIRATVDTTRAGGFDGLVVASAMAPATVLHHLVPLLRGGASVVVYAAHVEPLAELADYYSVQRKSAFIEGAVDSAALPTTDFPLDPTLLLAPTLYTVRQRQWQVLPGRTHPLMTAKGGPEGYVLAATRVLPITGEKVEARGSFRRRKKDGGEGVGTRVEETGAVVDGVA